MKLELTIDATNIKETLGDTFKSITPEEKKKLALEVMKGWLAEPYDLERQAWVQEKLVEARNGRYKEEFVGKSDAQVMDHYNVRESFKNFVSSREFMINTITSEITSHYKKEISAMIESDPKIQAMKEVTMEEIRENFPKYSHDALMYWFSQSMSSLMTNMSMGMNQSTNNQALITEIQNKLTTAGIY